ncbi:unnamed protein product, partial [Hapterophycus canaliculatus]
MSSSSPSLRESWSGPVSRSKSRKAAPSNLSSATATANTTAASKTANTQAPAIQRFSQYGARFNARVKKTGSGILAPTRSPRSLSTGSIFSASGGGGGGDGGGGGGGGSDGGDENFSSRTGNGVRGARQAIRERNRERKGKGPTTSSPSLVSVAGPTALAATINDTLTVTTGRAAWEKVNTSDSSLTNGSPSESGGGGGDGASPSSAEAWPWQPPETPPPACMPNLHQSSGSEGTSGSENDEGFGSGHGGVAGLDYQGFLARRLGSS